MSSHPYPIENRPFWTPGVLVMLALMIMGGAALAARFLFGIGSVANLNNTTAWGLWIGVDVASGVALAAGGFTTAFLGHIMGRHYYEPVVRPALLTAALGYTFVAFGVFIDIGRSWAIWKPIFFQNHDSALFEVAMCVVVYLHVLWIEFIPIAAERYGRRFPLLGRLNQALDKVMWVFIVLGVVLSCMHQSSLGTLMVIAPTKVSPLWYTPWLPLLFLLSAFAVGYPMVIAETTMATGALRLDGEMPVLSRLSTIIIFTLGAYMFVKLFDFTARRAWVHLFEDNGQTIAFLIEVVFGVIVPWVMLLFKSVRRSRRLLFIASIMIVLGVLMNRVNVFVVAFKAQTAPHPYFPAIGEILITVGAAATIMFLYRLFVRYLPVLSAAPKEAAQ